MAHPQARPTQLEIIDFTPVPKTTKRLFEDRDGSGAHVLRPVHFDVTSVEAAAEVDYSCAIDDAVVLADQYFALQAAVIGGRVASHRWALLQVPETYGDPLISDLAGLPDESLKLGVFVEPIVGKPLANHRLDEPHWPEHADLIADANEELKAFGMDHLRRYGWNMWDSGRARQFMTAVPLEEFHTVNHVAELSPVFVDFDFFQRFEG